jgi:hypothetical protein
MVAAGGLLFAVVAFMLGLEVGALGGVLLFLGFGLVAGLTESSERAIVARLTPVRTGHGFGVYHALTGGAALPAGLLFGSVYQSIGGPAALWTAAAGMLAAVLLWLMASSSHQDGHVHHEGTKARRS